MASDGDIVSYNVIGARLRVTTERSGRVHMLFGEGPSAYSVTLVPHEADALRDALNQADPQQDKSTRELALPHREAAIETLAETARGDHGGRLHHRRHDHRHPRAGSRPSGDTALTLPNGSVPPADSRG